MDGNVLTFPTNPSSGQNPFDPSKTLGLQAPGSSSPVSQVEFGEVVGSLIAQNLLLASKLDCLVDLLIHQGVITPELLDLYVVSATEEAKRRYDHQLKEIEDAERREAEGDEDSQA